MGGVTIVLRVWGAVFIDGDGGCGLIKMLIRDVETHRCVQVRSGGGAYGRIGLFRFHARNANVSVQFY